MKTSNKFTVGHFSVIIGFAQQQFILSGAEWVSEEGGGVEIDVRVRTFGLTSTAAVKVPYRTILDRNKTYDSITYGHPTF